MNKIVKFLLDLFFPVYCVKCKKEGEWVCEDCVEAHCDALGACNDSKNNIIQKKNLEDLTYIDDIFYFYDFNNEIISKLIHILKYKYAYDVARFLANIIVNNFYEFISDYNDLIIVPVPLNKKRFNERGFNQSEVVLDRVMGALQCARTCNLKILNLLKRIKDTGHQADLSKEDRNSNLKDAFCMNDVVNFEKYKNYNIIIFDDVVTTGNTIDKCAKVLKDNGFNGRIIGLCVAGQN